jgi:ankyrin repeat protein
VWHFVCRGVEYVFCVELAPGARREPASDRGVVMGTLARVGDDTFTKDSSPPRYCDIITMPLLQIPPEILLMIARFLIEDEDDDGELCFADLNSFLQVNRALYACLNRTLWQEAAKSILTTEHVFTHLIHTNDLTRLKFFLELGADLETLLLEFDGEGGANDYDLNHNHSHIKILQPTPLKVAAHLDNVPMARILLEHGADVVQYDELDRPSHSAIHAARSAEMVQLLLDHHADPEQQAPNKFRPLHYYAIRDNIEAMRAILRNGVEVDPDPTLNFPPPLHLAAEHNIDAVKLLLEHGADMKKKDRCSNTLFHLAARARKTDVVRFLVERWPDGMREKIIGGDTPLHTAAKAGMADMVKCMVKRWPDGMREKNNSGSTPLHLAAAVGKTEVVRFLLESWPEGTREKNTAGDTPLHAAAAVMGTEEVMSLLLACWPESKEALNEIGRTPLSLFEAGKGYLEVGHAHLGLDERQRIIALLGGVN